MLNSNRHMISLHSVNNLDIKHECELIKLFHNLASFLFWNNFTQINFTSFMNRCIQTPYLSRQERGLPSDSRLTGFKTGGKRSYFTTTSSETRNLRS